MEWTSVEDRLPEKECNCLGWLPKHRKHRILRFCPADFDSAAFFVPGITELEAFPFHWTLLPAPPKPTPPRYDEVYDEGMATLALTPTITLSISLSHHSTPHPQHTYTMIY